MARDGGLRLWMSSERWGSSTAVEERLEGDRWVVDGNYSVVRDIVWPRATDAVWLNYPFPIVFGRALVRTLRRIVLREELCSGNRESFRKAFLSRESILWWVIKTFNRRRRNYRALFSSGAFPNLRLIELRRPRDAGRLLAGLRRGRGGGGRSSRHDTAGGRNR